MTCPWPRARLTVLQPESWQAASPVLMARPEEGRDPRLFWKSREATPTPIFHTWPLLHCQDLQQWCLPGFPHSTALEQRRGP